MYAFHNPLWKVCLMSVASRRVPWTFGWHPPSALPLVILSSSAQRSNKSIYFGVLVWIWSWSTLNLFSKKKTQGQCDLQQIMFVNLVSSVPQPSIAWLTVQRTELHWTDFWKHSQHSYSCCTHSYSCCTHCNFAPPSSLHSLPPGQKASLLPVREDKKQNIQRILKANLINAESTTTEHSDLAYMM